MARGDALFRRFGIRESESLPTIFYGSHARVLRREPLNRTELTSVMRGWAKRDQDIEVIVSGPFRFVRDKTGNFVSSDND